MLDHLITSKARRLLLLLMFGERPATGTAGELAKATGVPLSNAQRELKAMHAAGWLMCTSRGAREVYAANGAHPEVELLRQLVDASVRPSVMIAKTSSVESRVRGHLRALGAPLRGVALVPLSDTSPADVLFDGVALARRDATIARTLPIAAWNARESLTARDLRALPARPEDRHGLGFILELAGELGNDRKLSGLADTLRDFRITSLRPFFYDSDRATPFPLAEKWGFTLNTDQATFASLFNKFVDR